MVTLRYALRLNDDARTNCRSIVLANLLFALGIVTVSVAQVRSAPRLDLLTLHSNVFGNTRTIRVWLPAGDVKAYMRSMTVVIRRVC